MTNNTFALQALRDCYEGVGSAMQQASVAAQVILLEDLLRRMYGETGNNCASCEHKKRPEGGHCYMFRTEPEGICMQHTHARKGMR